MDEYEDFVMGNESVQSTRLPSGVQVVCEHVEGARSVSLGVWMNVGSRHDPPGLAGAAHFIEHMLFKGTERRTARGISEEIDSVGGVLNAFTAKEHTCVYAKVLVEDFGLAADVLTDMLCNSTFAPEQVVRERSVILEEISTYEDAPDELVLDLLENAVWEQSGMGRPILGDADAVSRIQPEDMVRYYHDAYTTSRMVVAVAGGVRLERAVEELARPLEALRHDCRVDTDGNLEISRRVRMKQKQVEQLHLCLGAPGLCASDPRQYSMYVLNNALGGGPSSRLFQKVREERGLAYSVYSFHSSYHDTGVLGVYSASSPALADSVFAIIGDEVKLLQDQPVPQDELERCKRQLKGSLILGLEGTSGRMMRLGRSQLLLGRVVPLQEVISRIEAVTAEDVMMLARDTLSPDRVSLALVGPEMSEMKKIAEVR